MNFIQNLFQSRQLYINGELTSGYDLAKFAQDLKEKRVTVLKQLFITINGQVRTAYIETN
ncbi:MAG TPA: hypothetical protein GX745_01925 [Clostridiales bacterium]|nr:hypothetical protein [Clostridiales bacterium]